MWFHTLNEFNDERHLFTPINCLHEKTAGLRIFMLLIYIDKF